jgi:hypothetical protein
MANDKWKRMAQQAAVKAKAAAMVAWREADRLLKAARQRIESAARRRRVKQALQKTGRVLKAAGKAALVAGVAAGVAAARDSGKRKGRRRR